MFTKAGIVTLNQANTYNRNGQRVEKSEHASTRTYSGRGRKAMIEDKDLNSRQRLAKYIKDVRRIVGRKYNKVLLKSIKYAKTLNQFKKR